MIWVLRTFGSGVRKMVDDIRYDDQTKRVTCPFKNNWGETRQVEIGIVNLIDHDHRTNASRWQATICAHDCFHPTNLKAAECCASKISGHPAEAIQLPKGQA